MKDRYGRVQSFCNLVTQHAHTIGWQQYALAALFDLDASAFNRKLHNQRGLDFGPCDAPHELVTLIMLFVHGTSIASDNELNAFIAAIPECHASPKGT